MIAAFDVGYPGDGTARAAAVIFENFTAPHPFRAYLKKIAQVADYEPGSFYKRELPCILEVLVEMKERIDIIIVDCYVSLGDRPGLGKRLSDAIDPGIVVIGVAKNPYPGSRAAEAQRGRSTRPLFITSHGVESEQARSWIESMHGGHRLPTLLKQVDRLSRGMYRT